MKRALPFLPILVCLHSLTAYCQLSNGGIYAGFGVDADTRTNYVKYGPLKGSIATDDWFAPSGTGFNVIDTTNRSSYLSQLQSGANIAFNERMSSLLYAKNGGKLWIDAVYGRDYIATSTAKDATTFTLSCKNGDNPTNWKGGSANIPTKNDLVDVFAHMRRDGVNVHDSLWFFTGVSTFGTSGSSYYDVELYRKTLSYDAATGNFNTSGTEAGHTQWLFDAAGNITQTGDMIFAVSFSPGTPPVVDLRIWVSQTTANTVHPAYFDFTGSFDGSGGTYGYASIVSKAGTTAWGGGISNYSATAAQDTTYAAPWGTANASGTNNWSANFATQQFIEIGMNLTRIGVDPALYQTLSPCQALFSNIFFKSRSSTSFSSNLQDFMAPLTFTRPPVMDYSLQGDTLRCNHTLGTITLTNNATVGYFTWKTLSGDVTGANSDSSQLTIDKPGKYVVSASPAAGCPATRMDTIVIPIDTASPKAFASSGLYGNKIILYGSSGGATGVNYQWTGPNSFSSAVQNPITDTVWGTYKLTVTNTKNGCSANTSTYVSMAMFTVLTVEDIALNGAYSGAAVKLHWHDVQAANAQSYTIERSEGNNSFKTLAVVAEGADNYLDTHPLAGDNFYRVRVVLASGQEYYSPVAKVRGGGTTTVRILGSPVSGLHLAVNTSTSFKGVWTITNTAGQVLQRVDGYFTAGDNVVSLAVSARHQVCVVCLWVDGRIVYTGKVII